MTRMQLEALIEVLEGDREFLEECFTWGILTRDPEGVDPVDAEQARVARTLVRELEVNWPGVEIILRMRTELIDTRRQIAELIALLAHHEK